MAKSMSIKANPKRRKHNETHRHRKKTEEKKKVIAQPKKRMSKSRRQYMHRRRLVIAQEETLKRKLLKDYYAKDDKPKRVGIRDLRLGCPRPVISSQLLENARQKMSLASVQKVENIVYRELENSLSRRQGKFLRQLKMRVNRGGFAAANAKKALRKIKNYTRRQRCYLLEMPAEIRNRIYEYAVTKSHAVNTYSGTVKDKKKKAGKRPTLFRHMNWTPELAATCKQIRDEVLPIYFNQNTFAFRWDLGDYGSKRKDCQVRSFEKQIGVDIRWIRKIKCALVHIILPKPAVNHLFCESILTAEREKAGAPIKITVEHLHTYEGVPADPKSQVKTSVEGCSCSLQACMDAVVANPSNKKHAILELGRICSGHPFESAVLDVCDNCGKEQVVPR